MQHGLRSPSRSDSESSSASASFLGQLPSTNQWHGSERRPLPTDNFYCQRHSTSPDSPLLPPCLSLSLLRLVLPVRSPCPYSGSVQSQSQTSSISSESLPEAELVLLLVGFRNPIHFPVQSMRPPRVPTFCHFSTIHVSKRSSFHHSGTGAR